MQEKSSSNIADETAQIRAATASTPWAGQLLMLGLNYIPLLHAVGSVALFFVPIESWVVRIAVVWGAIYLLPPLMVRLILALSPIRSQRIEVGSREFFTWWASFQWQVLFCRLPALEELLRMVPGLYSTWLRLWGARIGKFTYWSAGTLITDRSFLRIGDNVVFGAGVRLNGHVITKENGKLELLLAPVQIGDRVMVGGYSLLTAGTEIAADEGTRAFLISPPFSVWKNGKRVREPGAENNDE